MGIKYIKSDPNPAIKFFFDESNPKNGHVLVRVIPSGTLREIQKRCGKKVPPEYRRGQRYEIPDEVNEIFQNELMWDYIIVDWDGIVDDNDKKIPCTLKQKIEFMQEWPTFAGFIANCLEKLNNIGVVDLEANRTKNSSALQSD